jgi:hypothetical protein
MGIKHGINVGKKSTSLLVLLHQKSGQIKNQVNSSKKFDE